MTRKFLLILGVFAVIPALLLLAGSAFASTVRVVVPAHDIARGDTHRRIRPDLCHRGRRRPDVGRAHQDGRSQRHAGPPGAVNAGQPFRGDDVRRPIIVTKGETVTMQFSVPGVELSAMGRAMSEGGIGDTVTVQNPASYRMISATVIAPGTVRATGSISPANNKLARR